MHCFLSEIKECYPHYNISTINHRFDSDMNNWNIIQWKREMMEFIFAPQREKEVIFCKRQSIYLGPKWFTVRWYPRQCEVEIVVSLGSHSSFGADGRYKVDISFLYLSHWHIQHCTGITIVIMTSREPCSFFSVLETESCFLIDK